MAKVFNNQKLFRFIPSLKDRNHPYCTWNMNDLKGALSELSVTAFKLYIYLGTYKEMKERFALSMTHATESLSISESSYHRAIKELQEKGYIALDPTAQDNVNFYVYFEGKT